MCSQANQWFTGISNPKSQSGTGESRLEKEVTDLGKRIEKRLEKAQEKGLIEFPGFAEKGEVKANKDSVTEAEEDKHDIEYSFSRQMSDPNSCSQIGAHYQNWQCQDAGTEGCSFIMAFILTLVSMDTPPMTGICCTVSMG